jgi:hypothetical protein
MCVYYRLSTDALDRDSYKFIVRRLLHNSGRILTTQIKTSDHNTNIFHKFTTDYKMSYSHDELGI